MGAEDGGSTLSTSGTEHEVAFQQLYPLTPAAPTESGLAGAHNSSSSVTAEVEAKIKSPNPSPFANPALLDGLLAFFDGFNNLPRNGFAAGFAMLPLSEPERLPHQVVNDLSDEQLGNVAAALLWARLHHLDVDVWIHHVRLEIIERFGAKSLPMLYR